MPAVYNDRNSIESALSELKLKYTNLTDITLDAAGTQITVVTRIGSHVVPITLSVSGSNFNHGASYIMSVVEQFIISNINDPNW